jgi:hypothetical protein
MSDPMFLDDLALRLSQRSMPLALESALFIVLEAMEALGSRALVLSPGAVMILPDGTIALGGGLDIAHDETSVLEGVVETLEAVLDPIPVGVTELAVKVRSAQLITRGAMLAELGAMLVPLNRRAARRMVGRLAREAVRPMGSPAITSTVPALASTPPIGMESLLSDARHDAGAHDTQVDGATLASATSTSLGGRLPDAWGDDGGLVQQRARERRNAWAVMAFAVVALVAAVAFLVERVRAAGA